jgi:hypothetical protein
MDREPISFSGHQLKMVRVAAKRLPEQHRGDFVKLVANLLATDNSYSDKQVGSAVARALQLRRCPRDTAAVQSHRVSLHYQ